MSDHNPNPFDFVPFADKPLLKTVEAYDALGTKVSGYLEVELEALTPLHVVGALKNDHSEGKSYMLQQNDRYCIPAASIRGCLRAFVEALTAGWVSQANQEYAKKFRARHVGFDAFKKYRNKSKHQERMSPSAINPKFKPNVEEIDTSAKNGDDSAEAPFKIDVASYLFGMVIEPEKGGEQKAEAAARKSKIWVEDAYLDPANVKTSEEYWIPDISGEAFMGGAKPSASNWWYFEPSEVWNRVSTRSRKCRIYRGEVLGAKILLPSASRAMCELLSQR